MPPPAYTAAGEAIVAVPPLPQDDPPQPATSRASTPERFPEPPRQRSRASSQEHRHHGVSSLSPAEIEATASAVTYSVFPVPRPDHGGSHGTRINAWVSDQADPTSRAQQPPNLHRPGSRYEPHSLQALQNLRSLTIPEGKAVGMVRPKHASVIDFSPLTPMLSQLQLGNFNESSAASSPSGETTSTERLRMSPLSQSTSISSFHTKVDPLQTPDETIATRMDHLRTNPASLAPLSLPAAAMEETTLPLTSSTLQSPTPSQIPPSIPEEWLQHDATTVISDHTSIAAFSSNSLTSSQPGLSGPQPREPDTAIGPRSSLYALSGFCAGAQAFKSSAHQDGVRRLAGHVAGVSTATARCGSCSYGHAFAELTLDVNDRSPRATFPRAGGVLFRLRLLYKSHLVAQRPSEAFYGCLFCAQDGAVTREGDATVFRASDDLFRHLARHPRPLPEVPGVTVLYGKEVLAADPRVNDFDLWLTEDPQPAPDVDSDVLVLPFATAAKSHVQRYAEKKLARPEGKGPDSLLQFFVGARIVGVEFPRQFAGKWCTGVSTFSCDRNPLLPCSPYPPLPFFFFFLFPSSDFPGTPTPASDITQRMAQLIMFTRTVARRRVGLFPLQDHRARKTRPGPPRRAAPAVPAGGERSGERERGGAVAVGAGQGRGGKGVGGVRQGRAHHQRRVAGAGAGGGRRRWEGGVVLEWHE